MKADGSDSGVPRGRELMEFAEDIVDGAERVAVSRRMIADVLSPAAMVDAAGVASNFERMVRIADATGIELDERMESMSGEIRETLGLRRPVWR